MDARLSWDRIPDHRYGAAIAEARRTIPSHIRSRLGHVRFLCGVDPVFAGFHQYGNVPADGRSYRDTSHCCYPRHIRRPLAERITTVVLPRPVPAYVIVHELGHALHEVVRFDCTPDPVSEYARTNRFEAFAEAFTTWLYDGYGDKAVLHADLRTVALFEMLAA